MAIIAKWLTSTTLVPVSKSAISVLECGVFLVSIYKVGGSCGDDDYSVYKKDRTIENYRDDFFGFRLFIVSNSKLAIK